MKFTWGHAITLVFILFAGYILYFVYQSFQTNVDLVAEDYYAKEVAFQDRINQTANAVPFKDVIEVRVDEQGLILQFPEEIEVKESKTIRDMETITDILSSGNIDDILNFI